MLDYTNFNYAEKEIAIENLLEKMRQARTLLNEIAGDSFALVLYESQASCPDYDESNLFDKISEKFSVFAEKMEKTQNQLINVKYAVSELAEIEKNMSM